MMETSLKASIGFLVCVEILWNCILSPGSFQVLEYRKNTLLPRHSEISVENVSTDICTAFGKEEVNNHRMKNACRISISTKTLTLDEIFSWNVNYENFYTYVRIHAQQYKGTDTSPKFFRILVNVSRGNLPAVNSEPIDYSLKVTCM